MGHPLLRYACAITLDDDRIIITGGEYYSQKVVSLYDNQGWIEDLASLNFERYHHACGHYRDDNGNTVSTKICFLGHPLVFIPMNVNLQWKTND